MTMNNEGIRREARGRAAQLAKAQRHCREAREVCRAVIGETPGPSKLERLVHAARVELAQDLLTILEPCP